MTPDEAIVAMWEIENDCIDGDGVTFDGGSDQWWLMRAFCPHVGWKKGVSAVSRGSIDLSTAFAVLLDVFRTAHADVPRGPQPLDQGGE